MSRIELDILKKGGKIYYSDTDSIITDIKLTEDLVDPKVIGKFKLEHELDMAIIPAPKVYCLKIKDDENLLTEDKKYIMKAKGGSSEDLTIENYEQMIKGVPMQIKKRSSKTDWTKGTVEIKDDTINLSPDNYISRVKIWYNYNWVDTTPRIVENNEVIPVSTPAI